MKPEKTVVLNSKCFSGNRSKCRIKKRNKKHQKKSQNFECKNVIINVEIMLFVTFCTSTLREEFVQNV